jgi:hypothetical protein
VREGFNARDVDWKKAEFMNESGRKHELYLSYLVLNIP